MCFYLADEFVAIFLATSIHLFLNRFRWMNRLLGYVDVREVILNSIPMYTSAFSISLVVAKSANHYSYNSSSDCYLMRLNQSYTNYHVDMSMGVQLLSTSQYGYYRHPNAA